MQHSAHKEKKNTKNDKKQDTQHKTRQDHTRQNNTKEDMTRWEEKVPNRKGKEREKGKHRG